MTNRICAACGEEYEPFLLVNGCPSSLCPCCGYAKVVMEEQTDAEEEFEKSLNREFEIPCAVSRDSDGNVTKVRATGRPVRTWARPSRYTWFKDVDDVLQDCGYTP